MASSKETYCLCGQPYNIGQFMIECDCCREWFHGSCVDVKIYQSDDIDKYHCPKCAQIYGPSILKIPTNNHRADRYELGAESKPAQVGTPAWVRALAARPLRPMAAALQRMRGYQFTEEFVRDGGFVRPILFTSPEGLELKTPNPATFTVRSVLRYCGAQLEMEVIDVRKQSTLRMSLGDFVDYFETPPETRVEKVLNVLSLEFSDTNLSPLVEPPAVTTKLDWAQNVWPSGQPPPRPSVEKYCLLSSSGSYTDWHLDFGGSTVWYHLMHGRKIFYLAPPTPANLTLYQQWHASNNHNERFFGDMVEWYGTCELSAGHSLVIPSGWLHAVYTPTDSLVFGGNLLHSYSIPCQLQIYEIERRVETPMMLRYPLFEPLCWYAAAQLLTLLHRYNEDLQDEDFRLSENDVRAPVPQLPPLLVKGVKVLTNVLKEWHSLKSTDTAKRDNVPKCLNSGQLVRELSKEIRIFEKRSSSGKDKEFKVEKKSTPKKSHSKSQSSQKKSLKLTLPKPIVTYTQNGEFIEEKPTKQTYNKAFIQEKEVYKKDIYTEPNYSNEDLKYNSMEEAKAYTIDGKPVSLDKNYVYPNYEEHVPAYVENNGYIERHEKKNGGSVLKIKLSNASSSREAPPPPYSLPEHSILKSHLIGRNAPQDRSQPIKPIQQWTISKKELGDYQEEQILYTNDNVQSLPSSGQSIQSGVQSIQSGVQRIQTNVQSMQGTVQTADMAYGPGMYSTEDINQDYQYETKPYQPDYSYQPNMTQTDLNISQQELNLTQQELITQQDLNMTQQNINLAPQNINLGQQNINLGQQNINLGQQDLVLSQQYSVESGEYIKYSSDMEGRYEVVGDLGQLQHVQHQNPSYQPIVSQEGLNGGYHDQLPSYDAAIAQQHYQATNYVIEEMKKPEVPASGPVRRSVRPVRRRVSPTYEYEDAELFIDESPPQGRRRNRHKYTHHASAPSYRQPAARVSRPAPANGIESLIQASVLAEEPPSATEDAAVAGMLSIGSRYPPPPPQRTFGLAHSAQPVTPPKPSAANNKRSRATPVKEDYGDYIEEEDIIKEVHRDDEYVYPALDLSSDDDEEWTASKRSKNSRSRPDSRSKSEKDAAWSPRARVGRLVPRVRAARSTRRACVRAALSAAAARDRSHATHAAHPAPHVPHTQPNAKRAVLATKSKRPPAPAHPTPKNTNKDARLKKGMKTAKQRLGKILKLHKMMH